jgi:hypothetical protein
VTVRARRFAVLPPPVLDHQTPDLRHINSAAVGVCTIKLDAYSWEVLGSTGAQATCWGAGLSLALHRMWQARQPLVLVWMTARLRALALARATHDVSQLYRMTYLQQLKPYTPFVERMMVMKRVQTQINIARSHGLPLLPNKVRWRYLYCVAASPVRSCSESISAWKV